MPSTILALQPNKEKIKGNFIANIFLNCVVQAFCLIITVVTVYLLAAKQVEGLDLSNYVEVNSICVIAITYVGVIILFNLCRPFNILRAAVCGVSLFFITFALFTPEIANLLSVPFLLKDMNITNKLFTLLIIFSIIPIEAALLAAVKQIKTAKNKENNG